MITTEELIQLIKETPNDMELGGKLRTKYFKFKEDEQTRVI